MINVIYHVKYSARNSLDEHKHFQQNTEFYESDLNKCTRQDRGTWEVNKLYVKGRTEKATSFAAFDTALSRISIAARLSSICENKPTRKETWNEINEISSLNATTTIKI